MIVRRLLSLWDGNFSGAMLSFQGVYSSCFLMFFAHQRFTRSPPGLFAVSKRTLLWEIGVFTWSPPCNRWRNIIYLLVFWRVQKYKNLHMKTVFPLVWGLRLKHHPPKKVGSVGLFPKDLCPFFFHSSGQDEKNLHSWPPDPEISKISAKRSVWKVGIGLQMGHNLLMNGICFD